MNNILIKKIIDINEKTIKYNLLISILFSFQLITNVKTYQLLFGY